MSTIVASGTAPNLKSHTTVAGRSPDPTLRRFVTFLTPSGSVHTIIADADHVAKTAEDLLAWFEHTRVGVELSSSRTASPLFKTADEVIKYANEAMGFVAAATGTQTSTDPTQGSGGVF